MEILEIRGADECSSVLTTSAFTFTFTRSHRKSSRAVRAPATRSSISRPQRTQMYSNVHTLYLIARAKLYLITRSTHFIVIELVVVVYNYTLLLSLCDRSGASPDPTNNNAFACEFPRRRRRDATRLRHSQIANIRRGAARHTLFHASRAAASLQIVLRVETEPSPNPIALKF